MRERLNECTDLLFAAWLWPQREELMLEGLDLMRLVDDGATVARQPPVVMQDAPVGRGGDEPDGGRDRHDGPATPCAGMLTGRALRAREHRLSFRVTPTVATSQIPMCCLGYGR